jgi:dipeptidyl aminopeptidase/acylaminoacyl peptidase
MSRIHSRARATGFFARHLLALCASLPVAACSDQPSPAAPMVPATTPSPVRSVASLKGDRLATIEQEGDNEVLYLQNADGSSRVRVRFQNVHDHVAGNYSSSVLPVTDETIRAIRRAKWSPDGQHLAVLVVPALDVAQVVLVSADGRDLRTVSPNSQYLVGDVDWSPDSRRIAYAMSTGPFASSPDVFVTTLGPDQVRRVTTSGQVSAFDTFRFDATGQRIHFTERLGWADDGVNMLSRLSSVDLTTGGAVEKATIIGEPQSVARDGSWTVVIRWGADKVRELVRVPLGAGQETVLATGELANAVLLEDDRESIVVAADPNDRNGVARTFRIYGVDTPNDVRATLPTAGNVNWAALAYTSR